MSSLSALHRRNYLSKDGVLRKAWPLGTCSLVSYECIAKERTGTGISSHAHSFASLPPPSDKNYHELDEEYYDCLGEGEAGLLWSEATAGATFIASYLPLFETFLVVDACAHSTHTPLLLALLAEYLALQPFQDDYPSFHHALNHAIKSDIREFKFSCPLPLNSLSDEAATQVGKVRLVWLG